MNWQRYFFLFSVLNIFKILTLHIYIDAPYEEKHNSDRYKHQHNSRCADVQTHDSRRPDKMQHSSKSQTKKSTTRGARTKKSTTRGTRTTKSTARGAWAKKSTTQSFFLYPLGESTQFRRSLRLEEVALLPTAETAETVAARMVRKCATSA